MSKDTKEVIKKKPLCIFTCGLDETNFAYAKKMLSSLQKTNPGIAKVADVILFTQQDFMAKGGTQLDMRRMTPFFAKDLIRNYETVVRLDADMIITGDISHVWEGNFDAAVVQNGNPREIVAQQQMMGKPVSVWDIKPLEEYVNCGFVVMKSEVFVDHWFSLCTPERANIYQFYEQDLLNVLCYYGNYKIRFLDKEDNRAHGLILKGYYSEAILKEKKLIMPAKSGSEQDQWPETEKEIVCIHFAGGQQPGKFDHLETTFQPEVCKYLKFLITDGQTA